MGHQNLVLTDPTQDYPEFLRHFAVKQHKDRTLLRHPVVINVQDKKGVAELKEFINEHPEVEIVDNYAEQYAELLLSKHAHLYRANYDVQVSSIAEMLDEH